MIQVAYPRSFIVWDFETTGLSPKDDRIVEVAVAIVQDGLVAEQWSSLIKIDRDIDPRAQEVHGITREMCDKEGKPESEVMVRLLQNLLDCEAHVTHNGTRFDIPFLEHTLIRLQQEHGSEHPFLVDDIREKHIDTAALYKGERMGEKKGWKEPWRLYFARVLDARIPGLKYSVETCCDEFGIKIDDMTRHRAFGDVLLTAEIYKRLTE